MDWIFRGFDLDNQSFWLLVLHFSTWILYSLSSSNFIFYLISALCVRWNEIRDKNAVGNRWFVLSFSNSINMWLEFPTYDSDWHFSNSINHAWVGTYSSFCAENPLNMIRGHFFLFIFQVDQKPVRFYWLVNLINYTMVSFKAWNLCAEVH